MKKLLLTLLCPLLLAASDTLTVAFWNVENLFDLEDDPQKNDEEFAEWAQVLLDQATLAVRGNLKDPASFVARLNKLMLNA